MYIRLTVFCLENHLGGGGGGGDKIVAWQSTNVYTCILVTIFMMIIRKLAVKLIRLNTAE